MKMINKKHILAGLLVAAAMAPASARAEYFESSSLETRLSAPLIEKILCTIVDRLIAPWLLNRRTTVFNTTERRYTTTPCYTNPEAKATILQQYFVTCKKEHSGNKIISSKPSKRIIRTSCPQVLWGGDSDKKCKNCPLFLKNIEEEVPLKQ